MIDLDPDHPVTKHFAVAYWKGGDTAVEREIYRPSRIERLTAWGGRSSMTHIQQYLVPGIELIAMNPKLSIAIVGREALDSEPALREGAVGRGADGRPPEPDRLLERPRRLCRVRPRRRGRPERLENARDARSTTRSSGCPPSSRRRPRCRRRTWRTSCRPCRWTRTSTASSATSSSAGVVVSRTEDPVDFADSLRNRVVNLVPVADIAKVPRWLSEATQTVGVYPESLHERLRDGARPRWRPAHPGASHLARRARGRRRQPHALAAARRRRADAAHGALDDRPELKPSCAC